VLFSADAWPGLADGSITMTFRNWSRPQARAGGRYRVGGILLEATAVFEVAVSSITEHDARAAGVADRAELLARLGGTDRVWRVDLRCLGPDDRRVLGADDELDEAAIESLRAKLARLDRREPWTIATLALIARYPGVVSTALARRAGRDRASFKLDVRKLKEIGLTESLDVGYRLSPRGEALLHALTGGATGDPER
jgi:hypothetical protein